MVHFPLANIANYYCSGPNEIGQAAKVNYVANGGRALRI